MIRQAAVVAALTLCGAELLWPHGQVRAAAASHSCGACAGAAGKADPVPLPDAKAEIIALLADVSAEDDIHPAVARATHPDVPPQTLEAAEIAALASRCAPSTPASLIQAIVKVESGGRPWLVSVNGARHRVIGAPDLELARQTIADLRTTGANFDTGLMQLNSTTLARLGVSPAEALEPCRNIAIGAKLFEAGYARAFAAQEATVPLLAASSSYNTGDLRRGYANGYADRVDRALRAASRSSGAS